MDYDQTDIPKGYDRARDHGPEYVDLWMNEIEYALGKKEINGIVDIGCGTGRFSEGLAARFDTAVTGIDPSIKMLSQAKAKKKDSRVRYVSGKSESMPVPSGSVDIVFMSMCFHHFNNPAAAIAECRRILRDQGFLVLRTGSIEQINSYPYVPFFPESYPILEEMLHTVSDTITLFESAGLKLVVSKVVRQTISSDWKTYADKILAGGDSALARLSDGEFDKGLKALRNYSQNNDREAVIEPIDLFVFQK